MKKSQVSIFIIIAVLLLIIILIVFIRRADIFNFFGKGSPKNQIENCIQEPIKEGMEILRFQGGVIEPENYYLYQDNKVEYLCYTDEYYKNCVMQKPFVKEEIEKQLKKYSEQRINDCIGSVKASLENQGYEISYKKPEISIELAPETIITEVAIDMNVRKEQVESYKTIKINTDSKLYEFAMLSSVILNWEAQYGDFDTLTYMINYPKTKIEKKIQDDGTRIYTLSDRESGEKFMFASRSMAFPAGLTGR